MDVTLQPGAQFDLPLPEGHTTVLYLFEGKLAVIAETGEPSPPAEAVRLLVLSQGDRISLGSIGQGPARFMLMAGAPYGEPIVPYGPFVMNTEEEIRQALSDLRSGTFVS
jgi:redox-sensitive bicupin YhaK (pirin superfamily)